MNADELQQKRALRQQRKKQKKRKKMIRICKKTGFLRNFIKLSQPQDPSLRVRKCHS